MEYTGFNFSDEIDRWSCSKNESEEEECIHKNEVCDGEDDCDNKNDEIGCPGAYSDYKIVLSQN